VISSSQRPLPDNTRHSQQTNLPASVGFEPKISGGERPAAAHLLRSWVQIPPGAWIFVCCECRVFSGRGLCDESITRPEQSYRMCCVVVCDLETSRTGALYIWVNDLILILLTWREWRAPNNASIQQMGFNSAFKGLSQNVLLVHCS
jgi:hypothetical protein